MSIMNVTIKADDIEVPASIHKAFNDKPIDLNQLAPNGLPISRINIDSEGNRVDYSDIVDGYKYADGKYVVIDKEDIKSLSLNRSSVLEIDSVIDLALIDPMLLDTPYFLGLDSKADQTYAEHQYAKLMTVVEEGRAAVGELTMNRRNYVVIIYKGYGRYLMMSTLRYLSNMREPVFELTSMPEEAEYQDGDNVVRKLGAAQFRPQDYINHYGERMKDLVANRVATVTGVTPTFEKTKS